MSPDIYIVADAGSIGAPVRRRLPKPYCSVVSQNDVGADSRLVVNYESDSVIKPDARADRDPPRYFNSQEPFDCYPVKDQVGNEYQPAFAWSSSANLRYAEHQKN